ncbi:MAG: lactonase family protein [Pirellulales bacterium]
MSTFAAAAERTVYFGTYTGGKSQGIYTAKFDDATGGLGEPKLLAKVENPSYIVFHPNGKVLYSVAEVDNHAGVKGHGGIAVLTKNTAGEWNVVATKTTAGAHPCHVSIDKDAKLLLVSNYTGGSLTAYKLDDAGMIVGEGAVSKHTGSSVNPNRQKEPHVHSARITLDGGWALVSDLGVDKIFAYKLDPKAQTVEKTEGGVVAPGSGPRHTAMHPDGKTVFVINEMPCTLTAFDFVAKTGKLTEKQTLSTLPADEKFQGKFSTAEVVVHPNGKFVYGSNRGHDTIAVFAIDDAGKLTLIQNQSTLGKTPRNFALDPSGKWLLCANQDSDDVHVFAVDQSTGKLSPAGKSIVVGKPVCVVFAE